MATFKDFIIPFGADQAISRGWTAATQHRPLGVTWHWTATWDLALCRRVLGGVNAERKGEASAHYGVGRSLAEGIDRYVSIRDRSWHAGKGQLAQWNGAPLRSPDHKGTRTTIGIETVNIGYERQGVPARAEWVRVAMTNGREIVRVQHWNAEQIELMVEVGQEIQASWPHITPRDHHGHHDLCPGYKDDVIGFPFATVLRAIYDDPTIPDVWSPFWMPRQRQRALIALDHDLGATGADGDWGGKSDAALRSFQRAHGLAETGHWSTYVSWKVWELLRAQGKDPVAVAGEP
ncbi:MAG: peptidoglycan recognition protein family protein [Longimicrobiales bacterium]